MNINMNAPRIIATFVAQVRSRLNRFLLVDVLIRSLAAVAALLTGVCLFYVVKGYAVPGFWYSLAAGAVLLTTLLSWLLRRWTDRRAAHYADDFFHLKDALSSFLSFRSDRNEGAFYQLQEKATAGRIASLDPDTIRYRCPRRLLGAGLVFVLLSSAMAFKENAPSVLLRQQVEAETVARTEEINDLLDELVDEFEQEQEKEGVAFDPDALREWVGALKQTKDLKEAMRQYARIERKLNEAARRLDQRKDEKLLTQAGEELKKDAENRRLGKKLEEKEYRKAAEDLEGMKPSAIEPDKLGELEKELARLKSAAQRMAAAAKAAQRQAGSGNERRQPKSEKAMPIPSPDSKTPELEKGDMKQAGNQPPQASLRDEMLALDQSMKDFEKSFKECQGEKEKQGKCSKQSLSNCQNACDTVGQDIDKLSKSLRQCQARKSSRSQLLSLRKKLGQCQQYLSQCPKSGPSKTSGASQTLASSQSLRQFMSLKAGGKKPGKGSVENRRDQRDPLADNGIATQLQGIKGEGTVQSSVEAANEGSGVSTLRNAKRNLEFSRQVESFVQREDVPEDVKRGVKEYFENIHNGE